MQGTSLGRRSSRLRPFRRLQSIVDGRRRGWPSGSRDHLVGDKPRPAVRVLGEHEHLEVVALWVSAPFAHVAKPLQDIVLAVEKDLADF
jgi:hypothetical protein